MNALKSAPTQTNLKQVNNGNSYHNMDDVELVKMCQSGDQGALDTLIRRHQRYVCAILYKLAPDWNDTDDLAQEAFIRIWKGIGNLKNPKAFKSWMAQIVTNLFYDELRKRPRQTIMVSLDAPIDGDQDSNLTRDVADPAAGPEELYAQKNTRKSVDAAIATLPRQFRTVLILRAIEDLPYEEIAKITACDLGTVKSRISRARTKVQNILTAQFGKENVA